jgi:hypothetical protein
MKNKELVDAIKYINPDAEFSIVDGDLDTIVWDKPKTGYPTKDEILAAVEPAKAQIETDKATKESAKQALLDRLGITAEEATLLLG